MPTGPVTDVTLISLRTTAVLVALLAVFGAVGGATAVSDARIVIDEVEASATEPAVGERTALNLTVSNSAGSPAAADVTDVRLLDDDGGTLDEATSLGALSAGDTLDAQLWTRFDEPGEQRLTVEVVAEQSTTDETVTVRRDVVVDVQPAEVALDLRTRAVSPADLRSDDDGDGGGLGVGGIEGLFGGGGGGLDIGDDDAEAAQSADSPVEVTVVNTGTTTADRVSLTAVGEAVDSGPFVVEDVAPGEERRVLVDLGPLDRRSDVTFTAAFRSGTDAQDGAGADRIAESTLTYPPREASPTITDATVQPDDDGIVVDANLGNAGTGEMEGVVLSVADGPGVSPTPAGGEYFVGTLGASDFVGFALRTAVNATAADEVPVRIEYTERGVRYTETVSVAMPDGEETGGGSGGTFGDLAGALAVVGLVGAAGLAIVGGVVRRRDV